MLSFIRSSIAGKSREAFRHTFRSGIEASDLKAKIKLRMMALSFIRDVSGSSSLKEKVGGRMQL